MTRPAPHLNRAGPLLARKLAGRHAGTSRANAEGSLALAHELATILGAIDRLSQIEDVFLLMREAVEFARDGLGVERVGIYLIENTEPEVVMRGTWGTSDRGVTTDERSLAHVCTRDDFEALQSLHLRGELWEYRSLDPQTSDRRRLQ